ncbi:MAG: RNB domain-containing ribonuclease [Victivallaceae bacterium]|nr:ribonuclease R family protein [Victivallaceae bacterium]
MKKEKKKRLQRILRRAQERRERSENRLVEANGIISLSTHGYGFVKIDPADEARNRLAEPDAEIFVPARFIDDALDGDLVRINFDPSQAETTPGRGPVGRVITVLQRKKETMVGEVVAGNRMRPMSRRVPADVQLSGSMHGAKIGDWIKVKVLPPSEKSQAVRFGQVLERIGEAGLIASDLDAVCAEYDLMPPYTAVQDTAAAALQPRPVERRDLRDMPTVTIDPTDAKDFDDAVGVIPGQSPDEIIIGVHISDVASYIAPGSEFDLEASKRGFTAYLPGRTLPMLPKTLTARISLQEGVDSMAHSVLFTVDKATGAIKKSERCHSIVHIDKRLDYESVQKFFDTGTMPDGWSEKIAEVVRTELEIAKKWREFRREHEKFIDLALPEIRIICDETTNKIIGLSSKVQRESEQLIEEYMLAANSAVAAELVARKLPGLFRVHPVPDPEKLMEFTALVTETFGIAVGDLSSRENCNKFIESLPHNELRPLLLNAFLRSLPRAFYQAEPALHFGLGKTLYSHFTSPIRRYTDTLVHQQLFSMDTNVKWKDQATLAQLGETLSEQEENNDNAYFSANDRLKLRYLDELLGKNRAPSYTGLIKKVTSAGLVVDITELGIYGFVPQSNFSAPVRRRRKIKNITRARRASFNPGDLVHVQLSQVDFTKGSALFNLI